MTIFFKPIVVFVLKTGTKNQYRIDSSSNSWHLAVANDNRPYFFNGGTYHSVAPILNVGPWYLLTGVQRITLDIYISGIVGQSRIKNLGLVS